MASKLKLTELLYPTSTTAAITINSDDSVTIPTQSTTNLAYTGTLTGGTGVVNLGSGQVYKDASGNVGIDTATPAYRLQVRRAGGAGSLGISVDGVGSVQRVAQYFAVGDSTSATTGHAFYTRNGTATDNLAALIDSSGNVGIGTSTISYGTAGRGNITLGGSASGIFGFQIGGVAKGYVAHFGSSMDVFNDSNTPLVFGTNGIERMQLSASGNLGLGVTPSAWAGQSAAYYVSQFGNAAFYGISTNEARMTVNAYVDSGGTNRYISNGFATRHDQKDGVYAWRIAASGTAGNAISFTQAMTLDASGNLLVGGTTASDLRIYSKGANTASSGYSFLAENSAGTLMFYIRNDGLVSTGVGSVSPYNNTTGVAVNMVVGSDGILYRSTSSLKYKTDVNEATHGLADLLMLRPVTYKGKNDGDTVFGGLIAEEVHEAGLTEFVQYANDGSPDALAYGNMVSLCIKAIQEQQALIADLTTRLTALEGN